MACLDTNVLIDLGGRSGRVRRDAARLKLEALSTAGDSIVISRFTLAELFVGVHLCDDPAAESLVVDSIAARFPILEMTADVAARYGAITAARRRAGRPIDPLDAFIAAAALSAGHALITRNVKDFQGVVGLEVQTY